jgi:nicotinate-nucleotide--dimethylbenzimidazole phosphoribosyltransferase
MRHLQKTLNQITDPDADMRAKAHVRLEQLTMPYWAMGRLMDLAEDLAAMTGQLCPPVARRAVVVMAGDHGVVAEGVAAHPQEITVQMVRNFVAGGAGINAMARVVNARVSIVDMGVAGDLSDLADKVKSVRIGPGTRNIARGPAMSREDAIHALEAGIAMAYELGPDTDLFATGEMGIGNTTPSSAMVAALTGCSVDVATGRGAGITEEQRAHKVGVIERALELNKPDPKDGVDVLSKVGGFEIGGMAGLMLGAAAQRKPVLIDGFISAAAALIAHSLAPRAAAYMIAGHHSVERGHRLALELLGKKPLLDLGLRLGEGTGATLAMAVVEAAARLLTDVATFDEAMVSANDQAGKDMVG